MKTMKNLGLIAFVAMVIAGCGSTKPLVESRIENKTSLEGEKVSVETAKMQGIEMVDDLSEDGLTIRKVAYKWYAGIGKANDKQVAIEIAEREARATISRVIENMVEDHANGGKLADNGEVQKTVSSYWKQMSKSIQNACEPFGDTKIEFSPTTKMYTATAKVGVRGDKFQQMLNSASNYKPSNLSGKDLESFIEINKSIMNAAKGK